MNELGPETDLLLRIRDRPGEEEGYPVEALLSDGSFFRDTMKLDLIELQAADNRRDIQSYGRQLYESLFTGWIGHAYESARAHEETKTRVRLWLDSGDPALQAVKWERLCYYYNDQFLPISVVGASAFSRYAGLGVAEPQPIAERPIKVLVAISNPTTLNAANEALAPLAVGDEVASLLAALGGLVEQGQMSITLLAGQSERKQLSRALLQKLEKLNCTVVGEATTLDSIARRLSEAHIFHFVGHGAFGASQNTTAILLEKEDGSGEWVNAASLVSTLTAGAALPHLIFLASCETARRDGSHPYVGLAAQIVQAGVPAVVAMQETITLDGARQLAGDFYRELLQDGVVDAALNVARARLYNDGPAKHGDWSTPVLFMRLRTGRLFAPDPVRVAMRLMAMDPDFTFFDPEEGGYVPLPIEVVEFTDPLQLRRTDRLDPETTAALDVQEAMKGVLSSYSVHERDRPVIIGVVGNFGSNKATQLKKLVWDCLQEGLDPHSGARHLPVYVDMRDYDPRRSDAQNSLEEHILRCLSANWPGLSARRLSEIPGEPALRLIFYGIDLVSADENARAQEQLLLLLARYPQHDFVISTTETMLDWEAFQDRGHLHLLVIQPLRRVKVRHLLENLEKVKTLPDSGAGEQAAVGEKLLSQIYRSQLFDLVATPWFMVQVLLRAARGDYPTSRTNALQKLVQHAIAKLPAGEGVRAHAGAILNALAWDMQRTRCCELPVSVVFQTMAEVRGHRGYDLERLYGGLLKIDLLFPAGDGQVSFAYEPFRAYCCARAIVLSPDREQILQSVISSLGNPAALRWWEDTLVLVAGLMAQEGDRSMLSRFLSQLVEGLDLLHGEPLFLAARCLMEATAEEERRDNEELEALRQHVVRALYWRTDSGHESSLPRRILATQLLSRVADPEVIIHLARLVYEKVRTSLSEEKDYEFSSVRMAGAIGLRRIGRPQEVQRILETQFHPSLKSLFAAWKRGKLAALMESYTGAENPGVQAVAALSVGDVAEQLWAAGNERQGRRALGFLCTQFLDPETTQSVRWALADALAMMDVRAVARVVVEPYLADLTRRDGEDESWKARDKCVAYLIGLVRPPGPSPLSFLIDHCIMASGDMRLWLCAMQALARVGGPRALSVLADIARGEFRLEETFADDAERCALRRTAISLLVEMGGREAIAELRRSPAIQNPALMPALYQATRALYWQETASAAL